METVNRTKKLQIQEFNMKFDFDMQNFGEHDVISFDDEMTKFGKFKESLKSAFVGILGNKLVESLECQKIKGTKIYDGSRSDFTNWKWFTEGKDCEILKIGAKGWQKGKIRVRVTLEFEPEQPEIIEPESPLDDLRRMMNENS
ncbi:KGK domain protein [Phormidium sp. LEGE 05292]|uniref:KGK domain-containing protein n=1 Tax=[Phormidium] sp. LEGE 05292 TaxID=767427 RepID=UPI001881F21B|nr:KGK domain-containing protein [Phormidium sp. LEGE 05292]MBE9228154.1 KGK domain protein [Phormidium sp. LEGE 05292]